MRSFNPEGSRRDSFRDKIKPQLQIEILAECIWNLRHASQGQSPIRTLGDLLQKCYRIGLLDQEAAELEDSPDILSYNFIAIIVALQLYDVCGILPESMSIANYYTPLNWVSKAQARLQLAKPFEELARDLRAQSGNAAQIQDKDWFDIHDLHLGTLKSVGGLKIEWCSHMTDHFELCKRRTGLALKVYWFECLSVRACTPLLNIEGIEEIAVELRKTMDFLFHCGGRKDRRALLRAYVDLDCPEWFCEKNDSEKQRKPKLGAYKASSCIAIKHHLTGSESAMPSSLAYSEFPYFGERIHILRSHMDRLQPRGLRGLWQDKRNTCSYWTLWLVVIFGGISVFLALASLIVSALQTWAAYHPVPVGG